MTAYPTKIVCHHVGGRNGTVSLKVLPHFRDDFVTILYDADADCIEHINSRTDRLAPETYVVPRCLGREAGKARLHLAYNPFCTSLYKLAQRYRPYYVFERDHDYFLGEACETVEERELDMVSLDWLVTQSGDGLPAPDFLSVDTEGADFDVLQGADRILAGPVLGVIAEVQFQRMFDGGALFGEVCAFLDGRGFDFVEFTGVSEAAPFRGPLGFRGRGQALSGDALYLRRFETLADILPEDGARYAAAGKLAYIAMNFAQVEYALAILKWRAALRPDQAAKAAVDATAYGRFLSKVEQLVASAAALYPPLYRDLFPTAAASHARTKVPPPPKGLNGKVKAWLLERPRLMGAVRMVRRLPMRVAEAAGALAGGLRNAVIDRPTPFERLLLDVGMQRTAQVVRRRRFEEQAFARKWTYEGN